MKSKYRCPACNRQLQVVLKTVDTIGLHCAAKCLSVVAKMNHFAVLENEAFQALCLDVQQEIEMNEKGMSNDVSV